MQVVPILMIRNEEYVIKAVLEPLCAVFDRVLVTDTGSDDRTVEIARSFEQVDLEQVGVQTPEQLGRLREAMGKRAQSLGYDWVWVVDGDELYTVEALEAILVEGMPDGKQLGFTKMVSVEWSDGKLWQMDDYFSRAAVLPAGGKWNGVYPFEMPDAFTEPSGFHYWGGGVHGFHLHRLCRSPFDDRVYERNRKRYWYGWMIKDGPKRVKELELLGLEATRENV